MQGCSYFDGAFHGFVGAMNPVWLPAGTGSNEQTGFGACVPNARFSPTIQRLPNGQPIDFLLEKQGLFP